MRDCGRKIHGLHAARPGSFNSRKTQRSLRMTIHPRNTKGAAMGCASVKEFNLYLHYTNFSRETGHACPIYFGINILDESTSEGDDWSSDGGGASW